ncbi:MAG: hypothetical protein J2P26_14515 [Nocardiopsaceae bacterium]|nr:hypothetical protein [Nocardiopsaceae bacterium]
MSHRRAGSSSGSSVIVEFHEFDGRWFVTDRWGSGYGISVPRPIRKTALGRKVLERVAAARSEWRSFITPADDAEHWSQFCVREAGVPPEEYRPEKRLVILVGQAGIRCQDARKPAPAWEPLPARSPRALGAALMQRISQLDPAPPEPSPATGTG